MTTPNRLLPLLTPVLAWTGLMGGVCGCERPALNSHPVAQAGVPALLILLDQSQSSHHTPGQRCQEAVAELGPFLSAQGRHGADVAVQGTTADGSVVDLVPWQRLRPDAAAGPYALASTSDWRKAAATTVRSACVQSARSVQRSAIYQGVHHAATSLLGHCQQRAAAGEACESQTLSIHSDGAENVARPLAEALRSAKPTAVPQLQTQGIGQLVWCGLGQGDAYATAPTVRGKKGKRREALPADHVQQVWGQVLGRPVVWLGVCPHQDTDTPASALAKAAAL